MELLGQPFDLGKWFTIGFCAWLPASCSAAVPGCGFKHRPGSFSPDRPEAKAPLRFCLTTVENPQPDVTVSTVDLLSCQSKAAACILALTPGKAGLMRRAESP